MEAMESRELLERYHRTGDEAAFAALVRGHLGPVHAAVVRIT
ncbi:MAG: hypothetical protein JWO82_914, partial [Akkermansiaceae bacterium]|nr:hypothetical protein [Akkermansiaceae bacterium]